MSRFMTRITTVGAILAAASIMNMPLAAALPPGGASPNTPGTSSDISPSTVEPCGTINFAVSGYPAGETLNIKIDDGAGTDQSVHGTGVVLQQTIDSNGDASGSLNLPCNIAPGEHWLRFLATSPIERNGEMLGNAGFSNHSPMFTVVAAGGKKSGSNSGGAGAADGNVLDAFLDDDAKENTKKSTNGGQQLRAGDSGASREEVVVEDNGSGPTTITRVIDEPGVDANAAGDERVADEPEAADNAEGGAKKAAKAKAGSIDGTTLEAKAGKQAQNNEQGAKKANKSSDSSDASVEHAAAAQGSNNAPIVGMMVGGAIVLVGLAGVGAFLYSNRNRTNANG